MAAVNASFFRMSGTRNAFRNVRSTGLPLDQLAGPARGLDLLAGGLRETVRVHGEPLAELAVAEHLDRDGAARGQAGSAQRVGRDLGARVEARLEVGQVHGLRTRAELLEGHRLLHRRAAQLAHPHVDRSLAALEAHALARAAAGARALVPAPGRLAAARAVTAPDALAVLARALVGAQGVQADALSHRRSPRGGGPSRSGRARSGGPRARRSGRSCRD